MCAELYYRIWDRYSYPHCIHVCTTAVPGNILGQHSSPTSSYGNAGHATLLRWPLNVTSVTAGISGYVYRDKDYEIRVRRHESAEI